MIREGFVGLVCDLDGVVYRGDSPIPGAADAIRRLADQGARILFCTNNSRPTVEEYVDKLARMGIEVVPEQMLTSAVVTGETLGARGYAGRRAMVIGGAGLREELERAGLEIDDSDATDVDLVALGVDPRFDYDALKRATLALHRGAAFVATNDDPQLPAPHGELWPGAGAILASVETASGRRAEVMGKPHEPMMRAAARRLEGAARVVVVGDRPQTDLAGAALYGWETVLVLSGVTPPDEGDRIRPRPDRIIPTIAAL